jgi:hypothetical protein
MESMEVAKLQNMLYYCLLFIMEKIFKELVGRRNNLINPNYSATINVT